MLTLASGTNAGCFYLNSVKAFLVIFYQIDINIAPLVLGESSVSLVPSAPHLNSFQGLLFIAEIAD